MVPPVGDEGLEIHDGIHSLDIQHPGATRMEGPRNELMRTEIDPPAPG